MFKIYRTCRIDIGQIVLYSQYLIAKTLRIRFRDSLHFVIFFYDVIKKSQPQFRQNYLKTLFKICFAIQHRFGQSYTVYKNLIRV